MKWMRLYLIFAGVALVLMAIGVYFTYLGVRAVIAEARKGFPPAEQAGRDSKRAVLGVRFDTPAKGEAAPGDEPTAAPARVMEVVRGTPADLAGLQPGDEIVAINDVVVRDVEDYRALAAVFTSKEPVRVVVRRGDREFAIDVQPIRRPSIPHRIGTAPTRRIGGAPQRIVGVPAPTAPGTAADAQPPAKAVNEPATPSSAVP